jgi:mannose-6-phosphate isomerase-like protein (cupin superfamily)
MIVTAQDIDHVVNNTSRIGDMVWNVMGQIYIPKKLDEDCFWWEAIMPAESFIPPHTHSGQDEFLYILEGELDMLIDGREIHAKAKEVLTFPRYSNHGLFNNSGRTVKGVFWVKPTNRLFDLFKAIHNVADSGEVIRISDDHGIHFQLPGQEARIGPLGR